MSSAAKSAGLRSPQDPASTADIDVRLPADAGVLKRMARILEQGGHWSALASVLAAVEQIDPADWRSGLRRAIALDNADDSPAAAQAIGERIARSHAAACALMLEQLAAQGRDALLQAALEALARKDAKALLAYVSKSARLDHGAPLLEAVKHISVPQWNPLLLDLAYAEAAEHYGRFEEADRTYAALEPSLSIDASPRTATPTPSTLLFRNLPLLECLLDIAAWYVERNGSASVHVAACSSGEEVYSLAAAIQAKGLAGKCSLSASDVDPALVERARSGRIDPRAKTSIPGDMRTYFGEHADGGVRFDDALLRRIEFRIDDMTQAPGHEGRYDLLVANNMLVHFPDAESRRMLPNLVARLRPGGTLCIGGSRQDSLMQEIDAQGLHPITTHAGEIFEAWRLQRHAWYVDPRPYWALPPSRLTASEPWRHTALFARDAETAQALEAVLARRQSHPDAVGGGPRDTSSEQV